MQMNNFEFYNPVRILFGKNQIARMASFLPEDGKILMTYGGGSIKRNGVYDQVMKALEGRDVIEFGGIEPNPVYESLLPAIEIVKRENVSFILAVGGGSVVDASKFIAAGSRYNGADSWDILNGKGEILSAVPLGVVLTLPATGSEMNGNSVITRHSSQEKFAFSSPEVMPVFSVLDPLVTYSLPINQVVNGVVDAFVHVIEQYLTYPVYSPVQDRYSEGLLQILVKEGHRAIELETPDYDNRATIMWAATNALNHFLSMGVITDWATHLLGHELTALHGLDHAVTLAIVLPGVLNASKETRKEKLLLYAEKMWGLSGYDHIAVIDEAIRNTENFFEDMGIKTRLSSYGIGKETIDIIEKRLIDRGTKYLGRSKDISVDDVRAILESRL
jgi:NADP-dependent alcohol dehydrogenase